MNPTVVITILSVVSTALAAAFIYLYRDNRIKTQALKQELEQRQQDLNNQKQVVQTNKEITVEELRNNRKELDKIIKSLTKVQAEKVSIEEVKKHLTNL